MNHNRLLAAASPLPPHFTRHSVVRPKLSWLEFIIRHAGSVAVDHTHMLPLNTLEAELKARGARPNANQRC